MKLTSDILEGFEFSTEIAGQHSCKGNTSKRIEVISIIHGDSVLSLFSVIDHKKEVVRTASLVLAVDVFNEIK